MRTTALFIIFATLTQAQIHGQPDPLHRLGSLIGEWQGTGGGFGNDSSRIVSSFQYVMNGQYIEVINDSKSEPSENKPEGEHHIDRGYISYDKNRGFVVFRQFNIEGFVNRYILNDASSNDSILVFETESIENLPEGKARWTINIITGDAIETVFDVAFTGDTYRCYGTNNLRRVR